jgi:hypothetical protein
MAELFTPLYVFMAWSIINYAQGQLGLSTCLFKMTSSVEINPRVDEIFRSARSQPCEIRIQKVGEWRGYLDPISDVDVFKVPVVWHARKLHDLRTTTNPVCNTKTRSCKSSSAGIAVAGSSYANQI